MTAGRATSRHRSIVAVFGRPIDYDACAEPAHATAGRSQKECFMSDPATAVIERYPSAVVVRVMSEPLDQKSIDTLQTDVSAAGMESPGIPVVLDMARIGYMPSLTLGGLVHLATQFRSRGQRLVLANLCPAVRKVLTLTQLDRLFEIKDDLSAFPGVATKDA